ncbi:hypothetical protein KI387_041211, partial [Taxus chinensis]
VPLGSWNECTWKTADSADLPLEESGCKLGHPDKKECGGRGKPVWLVKEVVNDYTAEWDSLEQEYAKDAEPPDRPKRSTFALLLGPNLGQ